MGWINAIVQGILLCGLLAIYSADPQKLQAGALETARLKIAGVSVGVLPLVAFATAVAMIGGLQVLCYRSALGRAFRATSDRPDIAPHMGLNQAHVFGLAMGIALAVTALAGVFLGTRTVFDPSNGGSCLIFGFEAVVPGGFGNLGGRWRGGSCWAWRRPWADRSIPGCRFWRGISCLWQSWPCGRAGSFPGWRREMRVIQGSKLSRGFLLALVPLGLALAAWWAGRAELRLMGEIFLYMALASL
jgi:hypothetical protein